jgi:cysteinyl-tRNA synthetase
VLERVRDPEVIRYFMLASHYRGPINYSLDNLDQADAALERLYNALLDVEPARAPATTEATRRFIAAMDDDLNTPVAIAELQGLARAINTHKAAGERAAAAAAASELIELGRRLGLLALAPQEFLRKAPKLRSETGPGAAAIDRNVESLSDAQIEALIDERMAARKAKNFSDSDRIRDLLAAHGIVLEDRAGGQRTLWRRGR